MSDAPDAPADFRRFLQQELARRCARNARYSLRAFALFLGVDHSTLSQILRGRRGLTEARIHRLGRRLGLDEAQRRGYAAAERLLAGRGAEVSAQTLELTREAAEALGSWHHFALLELTRLPEFRADARWIARTLGLTVDEVNVALQRLIRLGLLRMAARSRWEAEPSSAAESPEAFAEATFQALLGRDSGSALGGAPPGDTRPRVRVARTIAVDTASLGAALALVRRFEDEFVALSAGSGSRDDVYRLEVSVVPAAAPAPVEKNPVEKKR